MMGSSPDGSHLRASAEPSNPSNGGYENLPFGGFLAKLGSESVGTLARGASAEVTPDSPNNCYPIPVLSEASLLVLLLLGGSLASFGGSLTFLGRSGVAATVAYGNASHHLGV